MMDIQQRRAVKITAGSLIAVVILQVVYMALLGGPSPAEAGQPLTNADVIRYFDERGSEITTVWTLEAITFAAIALAGLTALVRGVAYPFAFAALALSGVFNLVQIGIGLAMFEPAARAGGDDSGLFFLFVSGAFFFFFLAKALIGLAASMIGLRMAAEAGKGAKVLGGLCVITGMASLIANIAAMALGNPALLIAGATGTIATLVLALALLRMVKTAA